MHNYQTETDYLSRINERQMYACGQVTGKVQLDQTNTVNTQ